MEDKRYETALERAREIYEDPREALKNNINLTNEGSVAAIKVALLDLFSNEKLIESESERIRKEIIFIIKEYGRLCEKEGDPCCTINDCLDWLEKKGEIETLRQEYKNSRTDTPTEHLPDWKQEYREDDLQTRFAFYTYKDEPNILYLSNLFVEKLNRNRGLGTQILKAAEKVAITIGATSIRVKVKGDSFANGWYHMNGYNYISSEDDYDWLEKNWSNKSTLDNWTEEDGEMKLKILKYLSTRCSVAEFEEVEGWLNNICSRLKQE